MQKYKNVKTGRTVEVNGKLTGKDWELVAPAAKKTAAKKTAAKKTAATKTDAEE